MSRRDACGHLYQRLDAMPIPRPRRCFTPRSAIDIKHTHQRTVDRDSTERVRPAPPPLASCLRFVGRRRTKDDDGVIGREEE
jgi:hypothetical protein